MRPVVNLRFNTMGGCDNMRRIYQSSTTNIHTFFGILFQDGYLPGVLSELTISIDVNRIFDASVNALRMPRAALTVVSSQRRHVGAKGPSAADMSGTTSSCRPASIIGLSLKVVKEKIVLVEGIRCILQWSGRV